MEGNGIGNGEAGKGRDLVDDAVRVVGRGAHKEDGVGIDQTANFRNRNAVGGGRARDGVEFDFEVRGSLVERGVGSRRNNPEVKSVVISLLQEPRIHFGLCYAPLDVCFLSCCETAHQDGLCATARCRTCTVWRRVEHGQHLELLSVYECKELVLLVHTIATTSASIFLTPGKTSG